MERRSKLIGQRAVGEATPAARRPAPDPGRQGAGAEMALAAGKRASFSRIALSPLVRFIKFYLVRQGFRDGLPGLIHIAIGCFNSFAKYAKMLERQTTSTR